jgi:hypothetical protein
MAEDVVDFGHDVGGTFGFYWRELDKKRIYQKSFPDSKTVYRTCWLFFCMKHDRRQMHARLAVCNAGQTSPYFRNGDQAMKSFAVGLALLVVMSGCIAWEPVVGPQIVYVDPLVEQAKPRVMVAPMNPPVRPLGCICYPFEVRQEIDNSRRIGAELGRVIWDHLIAQRIFGLMVYGQTPWPGVAHACEQARAQGIDLVAMGEITRFMQGGATGTTSLGFTFRIYEAETGMLLWSVALAGRVEGHPDRDYMVLTSKTRMPQAPEYLVAETLSKDLGRLLHAWTSDPAWAGPGSPGMRHGLGLSSPAFSSPDSHG